MLVPHVSGLRTGPNENVGGRAGEARRRRQDRVRQLGLPEGDHAATSATDPWTTTSDNPKARERACVKPSEAAPYEGVPEQLELSVATNVRQASSPPRLRVSRTLLALLIPAVAQPCVRGWRGKGIATGIPRSQPFMDEVCRYPERHVGVGEHLEETPSPGARSTWYESLQSSPEPAGCPKAALPGSD